MPETRPIAPPHGDGYSSVARINLPGFVGAWLGACCFIRVVGVGVLAFCVWWCYCGGYAGC